MTATVTLKGTLEVSGGSCVSACGSGSADRHVQSLSLGECGGQIYETAVQTPAKISVATAGVIGQNFTDLDILLQLSSVEFLAAESDNDLIFRVGAGVATLLGTGGTFPTAFAGGETLLLDFDGTAVSVAFLIGDQSAAQCVARINAACALAGLATPRAAVATSGQIEITGLVTGTAAEVSVTGGTGATTLGFAGTPSANGTGNDVRINGLLLMQFSRYPNAPTRIMVSGTAGLELTAAGKSAA